jgi:hypothetical protein
MDKIADVVMGMYTAKGEQYEDLVFDDKAVLVGSLNEQETVTEIKDEKGKDTAQNADTLIEEDTQKN